MVKLNLRLCCYGDIHTFLGNPNAPLSNLHSRTRSDCINLQTLGIPPAHAMKSVLHSHEDVNMRRIFYALQVLILESHIKYMLKCQKLRVTRELTV